MLLKAEIYSKRGVSVHVWLLGVDKMGASGTVVIRKEVFTSGLYNFSDSRQ